MLQLSICYNRFYILEDLICRDELMFPGSAIVILVKMSLSYKYELRLLKMKFKY